MLQNYLIVSWSVFRLDEIIGELLVNEGNAFFQHIKKLLTLPISFTKKDI